MKRELLAELLGSLLLAAAVVGSGIMGERLAGGNLAVALLANTLATVAALAVLIAAFAPISGAHFNPIGTLAALAGRQIAPASAGAYMAVQVAGCCAGAMLANLMFELPAVLPSVHVRTGGAQWLSEILASAGLVFFALGSPGAAQAAWRVPLWIGAAYWFTASTSFANPAITLGRSLSDSFSGIRVADVPGFVIAQLLGAALGLALLRLLKPARLAQATPVPPRN